MQRQVEALNTAWLRAWFDKDAAAVDRMMTEDYIYIAPNGAVLDRDAILAVIRDPSYSLTHGGRVEVAISMLSNTVVVVRHRWQGGGTFRGTPFEEDHRCTVICTRGESGWQVRHEHCSAIKA